MELVSPDSLNISPQIPRDVLSSSSSYETYNFKHRSIVEREQKNGKNLDTILDWFYKHVQDIQDSSFHVIYHTIVSSDMPSVDPHNYHPFNHYLQRIDNLEERTVTAETLLIYL